MKKSNNCSVRKIKSSVLLSTIFKYSFCLSLSLLSFIKSTYPEIAVRGILRSWEILVANLLISWFPFSYCNLWLLKILSSAFKPIHNFLISLSPEDIVIKLLVSDFNISFKAILISLIDNFSHINFNTKTIVILIKIPITI